MQHGCSTNISCGGLFFGRVSSKIDSFFCYWMRDARSEFAIYSNANTSSIFVFSKPIHGVLCRCGYPKIRYAIIVLITVDVVNIANRISAVMPQPNKTMNFETMPQEEYGRISL